MAKDDHLDRLRQGVKGWNAWRSRNPNIQPDLRSANLIGVDLMNADLAGATLVGANLNRGQLSWANLYRADLRGADLAGALARGVNFCRADLRETDLSEANLDDATLLGSALSQADLSGASLSRAKGPLANLAGVQLSGATLTFANFFQANFRAADLTGADLSFAHFSGANLEEVTMIGADCTGANFADAKFFNSDLKWAKLGQANFIDANLDKSDVSGALLWEIQRSGWSIKQITCSYAFWTREGVEQTEYQDGEFERLYAEKPRIVLRYPGGLSPVELFALPLVVERLQTEHPGSVLQVRSVQNDAGGASVVITVEDVAGRSTEAFREEFVRIQTRLECLVDERDRLQHRLDAIHVQLSSRVAEILALPKLETHIHQPTGSVMIEGKMSGDTFSVSGQAGAVGPGAQAHDNTFQQIQGGIDLPRLADELGRLRAAMKAESTGSREQDKAIGAVADAEGAAAGGDGPAALRHLKSAGRWTLGVAEKIGVAAAVEVLKRSM